MVEHLSDHDKQLLGANGADGVAVTGKAELVRQAYNTAIFHVTADRPAALFWRSYAFNGWSATVAGEPRAVMRAFNAFKAVVVPEGESEVVFRFTPQPAALAWPFSAAVLLGFAGWAVYCHRRPAEAEAHTAAEPGPSAVG